MICLIVFTKLVIQCITQNFQLHVINQITKNSKIKKKKKKKIVVPSNSKDDLGPCPILDFLSIGGWRNPFHYIVYKTHFFLC